MADDVVLSEPPSPSAATMSNEELRAALHDLFRLRAVVDGRIIELLGEVGRREAFRDEGATSTEAWTVERFAVSVPTARTYSHVAERAPDLPQLTSALCDGSITLDKMRAVVDVATPETDEEIRDRARSCTVRELAELARSMTKDTSEAQAERDYAGRSLRFNDTFRTVTAQLPAESYAEVRAALEGVAKHLPSEGETPWDQRLCDAFLSTIRSSGQGGSWNGGRHLVVAHVPLDALIDPLSDEVTELAGELERGGLISAETIRRISCDARIAIAVDDDVGRTMFEGRARRDPTDAQRREIMRRDRHCRFPGCTNVTFTNVHHIVPWIPDGLTDIDNLALLCDHHHHRVHSRGWTMSGDANEELTFVGPTGRPMPSRPSPMWTAVTRRRPGLGGGPAARDGQPRR
jgi:5-methylcytosine-specific restriction endonuclease McrA